MYKKSTSQLISERSADKWAYQTLLQTPCRICTANLTDCGGLWLVVAVCWRLYAETFNFMLIRLDRLTYICIYNEDANVTGWLVIRAVVKDHHCGSGVFLWAKPGYGLIGVTPWWLWSNRCHTHTASVSVGVGVVTPTTLLVVDAVTPPPEPGR